MSRDFNGGVRANPKRDMSDEERAYILKNHNRTSCRDMAKLMLVSESKVQSWVKELGINKIRVSSKNNAVSTSGDEFYRYNKDMFIIGVI